MRYPPALATVSILLTLAAVTGCSNGGGGGGAPALPANALVEVDLSSPTGSQSGFIDLGVELRDDEGDAIDIQIDYTLDGASYTSATLTPSSPGLGGLAADADGEIYTFTWDSVSDGVGVSATASGVRLRVTAVDPAGSRETLSVAFEVDNTIATAPAIVGLSPDFGPGGTVVTISGFNLGDDPAQLTVRFGVHPARVVSLSTATVATPDGFPSDLIVIAPPESGAAAVEVDPASGGTLVGPLFHGAPRVEALQPSGLVAGQTLELELHGAALDDGSVTVTFDDGTQTLSVAPSDVAEDLLRVPVPAGLVVPAPGSTIAVTVTHDGGPGNTIGVTLVALSGDPMTPATTLLRAPLRSIAGRLPLELAVFDNGETDLADLSLEFSLDGTSYAPMSLEPGTPTVDVVTSPFGAGRRLSYVWQSDADIGSQVAGAVRLRVTATAAGGAAGGTWTSAPVEIDGTVSPTITITESFDDNVSELVAETTADWNGARGTPFGAPGMLVGLADVLEEPWGDGSDGTFQPSGPVVLTTDGVDPVYGGLDGVYRFSSFILDPGIELTAVGSHPLDIRVTGDAIVRGTIDLSGADGGDGDASAGGSGGSAGAGATPGGIGGFVDAVGSFADGADSAGGGRGGATSASAHAGAAGGGGGGGGSAETGTAGETAAGPGSGDGGDGGLARGSQTSLDRGVGGGGGGGAIDATGVSGGGGGGGGGGGTLLLTVSDAIIAGGTINITGGNGGAGSGSGGGGGGSGGVVVLRANGTISFEDGVDLDGRGGAGGAGPPAGGAGSDGRLRFESPFAISLPSPAPPLDLSGISPGPGEPGFSLGTSTPGSFDPGAAVDGTFAPGSDVTLTTDGIDPVFGGLDGVFEFDSISIPAGVTVTAMGSNPLVLKATGDVIIDGVISVAGVAATLPPILPPTPGSGGAGGPGGGAGGLGGSYDFVNGVGVAGENGSPPAILGPGEPNPAGLGAATVTLLDPDPPGPTSTGGGGGGAGGSLLGETGTTGAAPFGTPGGLGGPVSGAVDFRDPGDPATIVLQGGSGGGGGGGNINDSGIFGNGTPGGGGGGGGGACHIVAGGAFTLGAGGLIDAQGGDGGASNVTQLAGNGGGGSGGGVLIQAVDLSVDGGAILATGGPSPTTAGTQGGAGAPGRVRLESPNAPVSGTIDPPPTLATFDSSLLESVAVSQPIALTAGVSRAWARSLAAVALTPAAQTPPTALEVLWGVWSAAVDARDVPVSFSGFVVDPALLPRGEFLQFRVVIRSETDPGIPGSLSELQMTTD